MKTKPEDVSIGTKTVESRGGWIFRGYEFGEIVRETKTQWVSSTGTKYYKKNLKVVGNYGYLTIKTEEHVKAQNIYCLKSKIGSIAYDIGNFRNKIPSNMNEEELKDLLAKVEEVYDIIKPKEK